MCLLLTGQARAQDWQRALAAATSNGAFSYVRSSAMNAAGDVFVTGEYNGQITLGSTALPNAAPDDVFIAKWSAATNSWAWAVSGGGNLFDEGQAIAVSGNSVYVTGQMEPDNVRFGGQLLNGNGDPTTPDMFLVKYTDNGSSATYNWAVAGGGVGPDAGFGLTASGSSIYVTGVFANNSANITNAQFAGQPLAGTSSATSDDIFLAKYTDNGSSASGDWAVVAGGAGNDWGVGLAVSGSTVYLTGMTTNNSSNANNVVFGGQALTGASSTTSNDAFVASYTDQGSSASFNWARSGGGTGNDWSRSVATNGTDVFITGYAENNSSNGSAVQFGGQALNGMGSSIGTDLFLVKYSAAGTYGWAVAGGGSGDDGGLDLAVEGPSIWVTGYIRNGASNFNNVQFGGQPLAGTSGTISREAIVVKYTDLGSTASYNWGRSGGGDSGDQGDAIVVDGSRVFMSGSTSPPSTFGSQVVSSPVGPSSALLAEILDTAPVLLSVSPASAPVGGTITITGTNLGSVSSVYFAPSGIFQTTLLSVSPTSITLTVPIGATSGSLAVPTGVGFSYSNFLPFAVMNAPTATGNSRCGAGTVTLSASGAPAGGSYRWYTVASGGTAIAGATSSNYTTPSLVATTTYYVSAVDGSNNESSRTPVVATVNYSLPPSIVAGGSTTLPAGGSVSLTARPNLALSFSGLGTPSSQHVATSLAASPAAMPNTTWEAWVYPTRVNHSLRQTVFSVDDGDFDRTVLIEANTANWSVFTGNLADPVWEPVAVDLNQWQHIAVVYSSTGIRFYKNGVEYIYGGGPNNSPAVPTFMIGRNPDWPHESWQGQIDEVRVWNVARSQAAIQGSLYSVLPGNTAGLMGYWRFNEGSGTTAADETGNNAGTLVNGPTYVTPGQSSILASTYSWSPASGLNSTSAQTVTASPGSTTTYTVTVTDHNGCTPSAQQTVTVSSFPDLVISTPSQVVSGGTYNSITVLNGGVGTLQGPVTVNTSVTVQSGGALSTNCQPLTGAGSFTLAAGGTLIICDPAGISASGSTGAIQTTGARSFSPGANYVYSGSSAQVTGSGLPSEALNLTVNNPAGLTLSQAVAVRQVLRITPPSGNFNLNGRALTLLSDAAGTALVTNEGAGVVVGSTATVQRQLNPFFNTGAGYRHYSAPVSSSTVADLATAGFTPVVNPNYNTSPTPGLVTPFPTVYGYDQSRLSTATNNLSDFDKGWFSPAALNTPLQVGRGYTVNIASNQKVDFTGTLNAGDLALPLARTGSSAEAGWHLVGNPYPAPIDFSLIAPADRANLDGSMYVYESNGRYSGTYRSYANGIGGDPLVAMGQGFFVRVSAGQSSGTLTFRNAQRLTSYGQQVAMYRGADPRPQLQLHLQGAGTADDAYVYFEAGATAGADAQFDAVKLLNPTGLNLSVLSASGERLAIQGLPTLGSADVRVPLRLQVPAAGTYTLSAPQLRNLPTGTRAILLDLLTGARTDLSQGGHYAVSLPAAFSGPRFELLLTQQTLLATAAPSLSQQVLLYPNPAAHTAWLQLPAELGQHSQTAQVLDALGRVVRELPLPAAGTAAHQVSLAGLRSGVYTLRMVTTKGTISKRLVVE